jgi:hypothetical protein
MVLSAADAVRRNQVMDTTLTAPLRATPIGPRASLRRYTVAAERVAAVAYDKTQDVLVAWPGLAAGETPDLDYARVYLDNARLNYFNKYIGIGGSAQASSTHPNRVRAANYVFKTANGTARSADFYDRDVRVGDVVTISAVVSSVLTTHTSSVTGFVGEPVAAVTAASTADANNKANQGAAASVSQVAGTPVNDVVAVANGGAYNSLADGGITRTYTVTVIQSSTGGDATTARLRVQSSDGLDDVASVTPSAFGAATPIGNNGLTGTFSIDPLASSASSFGLDEDDFLVGQQWTFQVAQAFTQATHASAGTYTGPVDDTYIITVSRGGTLGGATPPQITVSTTRGSDSSGPTNVTASAAPTAVGSYGVTIAFTGTQLRGGDVYYVGVTAAAEGAVRTLTLAADVPAALRGIEVDLRLFIPQTGVELARTRTLPALAVNWTPASAGVTLEGGIYLTDPTLTNGGALVGVPLESASVYVHYRAWAAAPTTSARVVRVTTPAEAVAALGTSDPDNPICWAATRALANTPGQLISAASTASQTNTNPVVCVLTGDPAVAANWTAALDAVEAVGDAYHLVPLTTDATALAAVAAHVAAQSTDALGFHRVLWAQGVVHEDLVVVGPTTTTDGQVALATIAQYPGSSPAAYTLLSLGSANADFLALGARAGDTVRISYAVDALGVETYDSYVVAEVISGGSLRLASGPAGAIAVARRIEVWRRPTADELVDELVAQAAAYSNPRVRLVWPDLGSFGGAAVPGHTVAAAVAGLAGSVPTHQGLKGVGLAGVDAVPRSDGFFLSGQLKRLGENGVFVVSADGAGNVYVRAAVTTAVGAVQDREEMCVRNADAIRFAIDSAWEVFFGISNVTDQVERELRATLGDLEARLKSAQQVPSLGAPVQRLEFASAAAVPGAPDLVAATVNAVLPAPLNSVQQTLTVNLASAT